LEVFIGCGANILWRTSVTNDREIELIKYYLFLVFVTLQCTHKNDKILSRFLSKKIIFLGVFLTLGIFVMSWGIPET
jgi:hypothetical protein